jgi:CheY-like chemotaxis protein/HPt (histidine-containing phosphotransfer) domain-containing protein
LVVDDNATNRRILAAQAANWGMQTSVASSADEALEVLTAGSFDVVVSDMLMPEIDGLDLGARIQERWPELPFVIATSLSRREVTDDPRMSSTATVAVIAKPVKLSSLLDALVTALGGKTTQRRSAEGGSALDPGLAQRHPLRILLAEDNVVNQKLAVRLLEKMGYRTDVVGNGLEALEALERQPYDLLLTDVQMPEMDGLEATREIVRRWPAGERPWIVAMTAEAMAGDRERCLQAGMNDYVSKPIRPDELAAALVRAPQRGSTAARAEVAAAPVAEGVVISDGAIDVAALRGFAASMGEDDPGFVQELIGEFLRDAPALVTAIAEGVRGGDADGARRAAHTLKSNASTFGAMDLAEHCRTLEAAAKEGDLGEGERLAGEIATLFEQVRVELPAAFGR